MKWTQNWSCPTAQFIQSCIKGCVFSKVSYRWALKMLTDNHKMLRLMAPKASLADKEISEKIFCQN